MPHSRARLWWWLVCLSALPACDTKTKSVDKCGDEYIDPAEECDGANLQDQTCASLGHYNVLGTLRCTAGCMFDREECGGRCGDGVPDADEGEECDGANLNGNSCQSLGHGGGTLACTADCLYDRSGCTNACGNGYLEGDETCDDGAARSGDGCSATCEVEPGWACDDASPSVCTPVCQDGQVVGDEPCDGANLGGRTCLTLGYYGGALVCNADCTFDLTNCEAAGHCGDGLIQAAEGELCDGAELNSQTCETLGYYGGTLTCAFDCTFELSGCEMAGRCGDGAIQEAAGELCDGTLLGGQTCLTLGYYGGMLGCAEDCRSYGTADCASVGRCGDLVIQSGHGEVCDGFNTGAQTCTSRGWYGGVLACTDTCTAFDELNCAAYGRCGDDIRQETHGEACDGTDLGGATCLSLGYHGGTLECFPSCLGLNDNPCRSYGRCGDGVLQTLYEACDGIDFYGETCATQTPERPYGSLTCDAGCLLVTDACQEEFIPLVDVPGGTFQRDTTITNLTTVSAFRMSRTEVTRWQFYDVMGVDPSSDLDATGPLDPVHSVNWYQALAFCNKLSLREGLTPVYAIQGVDFATLTYAQIPTNDSATWNAATSDWSADGYRLPTAMEWWWAAMGADTASPGAINTIGWNKAFAGSDGTNSIDDYVWYQANSAYKTHPTATLLPNELALFDLSGNVAEWSWDLSGTPPPGPVLDWRGGTLGTQRVLRGGNRSSHPTQIRLDVTNFYSPSMQGFDIGFRVVRRSDLCGDGVIQATYGEECEGANLAGGTCRTQGWYGGVLDCDPITCRYDTSQCEDYCGDGILQYAEGEVCDGANLDGEDCLSLGWYGGTLACDRGCLAFDEAGCASVGRCGDGVLQDAHGETCDGADFGGLACADLLPGSPWGSLLCDAACQVVTTGCRADFVPLVAVPGGTFQRDSNSLNLSTVAPFRISSTEVTRAMFLDVMGYDPSDSFYSSGPDDPVQKVNWYHAIAFCNKLSLREGLTPVYTVSGVDFSTLVYAIIPISSDANWNAATADWGADGYRLPTEMEWWWAAMGADTATPGATNTTGWNKAFAGSNGTNLVDDYAWYNVNAGGHTHTPGTRIPNELVLFDLSGNVNEWVWDWYSILPAGTLTDYRGPAPSSGRIYRGGGLSNGAAALILSYRTQNMPQNGRYDIGFRVVRAP